MNGESLTSRCHHLQVLKGKVVKALDNLYHPDCFVCFKCSASLSGTRTCLVAMPRRRQTAHSCFVPFLPGHSV